jgi:hypothetical protein
MPTIYRDDPAPLAQPDGPVAMPGGALSYIHWGPVIAGAIAAAATSFVLMTFASAIGLAVVSPSPTWRDASVGLAILSGTWIILVAVGSFALGGYIAGRVRSGWKTSVDEIHFRDGLHGLLVWAIGVLIGAGLAWATAVALTAVNAATTGPRNTSTTEPSFLAFELDRLFRSERSTEAPESALRAEAGRIIMTGLGRRPIAPDDRTYLVRVVSARAGLAPQEAEQRVERIVAESQAAVSQARRGAIILGFTSAAALVAGAAAAWVAARSGGQHRDNEISPPLRWSWRRRTS